MAEERFDVIIVGGGLAGLSAAYVLAGNGKEVLLIEKGNFCGSKNMTGGRIYTHSLTDLIPEALKEAPLERRIVKERITFGAGKETKTIEYSPAALGAPYDVSYAVLRAGFDRWMSEKAEEAGAMIVCGVKVDDLMKDGDRICGVIAGEEEMEADVVLIADGVNSILSRKLGYKNELKPEEVSVGVKEVIRCNKGMIEERFGVGEGEGVAWMFRKGFREGQPYDAYVYTNNDSVSLEIALSLSRLEETEMSTVDMMDAFSNDPLIRELIDGGKLVEYSAHLIPEAGLKMTPKLVGDGVLLAGDAAGLVADFGVTIRGMDLAIESGRLAAEAILAAGEKGGCSADNLLSYEKALEESYVRTCLEKAEACRAALTDVISKDDAQEAFDKTFIKDSILPG